jgi:uncharacterized protein
MAIRGVNRDGFEAVLKEKLSPTTPIRTPEALKGREKILEEVRRSFVQPGRHVFIHGDRGVGKTSLAQTAAIQHQSSDGAPIFIGCDNASTFYAVARNISQKLASGDPTVSKETKSPPKWYDDKADNPPWIKALADVRRMATMEGYCLSRDFGR